MTEHGRCASCGGRVLEFPSGRPPLGIHRRDCPALPKPYQLREVTLAARLAVLEVLIVQLLEQVRQLGLHAPAPTAWPDDGLDAVDTPPERTLAQQLRIARRALRRLDPGHVLVAPLTRLLQPGFQAPHMSTNIPSEPVGIVPPWPIHLALERLRHLTPPSAPLSAPQPSDSAEVAKDRRLVKFWADCQPT